MLNVLKSEGNFKSTTHDIETLIDFRDLLVGWFFQLPKIVSVVLGGMAGGGADWFCWVVMLALHGTLESLLEKRKG